MKRRFIMVALLSFTLSCGTQQSAEEKQAAEMALKGINVVQEDGTLKIVANEKAVLREGLEAGKPAPKHKFSEEDIVTLEVVESKE
ncbi:MAG: hypothetical protein J6R81_00070 [Alistipes sp.]|nr:hypothetical protein [Alistipes sp.]